MTKYHNGLSDIQSKYVEEEKKCTSLFFIKPLTLYSVLAREIASAVQQLDKPWGRGRGRNDVEHRIPTYSQYCSNDWLARKASSVTEPFEKHSICLLESF